MLSSAHSVSLSARTTKETHPHRSRRSSARDTYSLSRHRLELACCRLWKIARERESQQLPWCRNPPRSEASCPELCSLPEGEAGGLCTDTNTAGAHTQTHAEHDEWVKKEKKITRCCMLLLLVRFVSVSERERAGREQEKENHDDSSDSR